MFIAFEGIDGCGKSTQVKKFIEYLFDIDKHNHIFLTREPYKDVSIRKILREDSDPYSQSEKIAELYIKDRLVHINEVILPNLEKGNIVVTDRYKLSTLAYQTAQGIEMSDLISKHNGFPVPDFVFIIDVSPETASKRMKKEDNRIEQKFESNLEFIKTIRENYLASINELDGENIFLINGEQSPDKVHQDIVEIFTRGKV